MVAMWQRQWCFYNLVAAIAALAAILITSIIASCCTKKRRSCSCEAGCISTDAVAVANYTARRLSIDDKPFQRSIFHVWTRKCSVLV